VLASTALGLGLLASRRTSAKRWLHLRQVTRRRPLGVLLAAGLVLSFVMLCVAPTVPLLRMSYDAADVLRRVTAVQGMLTDGPAAVFDASKLDTLQEEVDAIQGELRELSGATTLLLAPAGALSARIENYRLLIRTGAELATASAEGIHIVRLIVPPLESGALSSSSSSPGLTAGDVGEARDLLADAEAHLIAALTSYRQLDPRQLPSQFQPGSRYGDLLARLPQSASAFGLLDLALAAAPSALGIGSQAYYLLVAMDRSELRPIGGLMGNYGIVALDGGRQSKLYPLSLHNTYDLDSAYYLNPTLNTDPNSNDTPACLTSGPQPPEMYWWWPIRNFSCEYGWGLRDAGLSADFPTNARIDLRIAQDAGAVPGNAPLQGMIAFTPVPIEHILQLTGPLAVPDFNTTVSANSIERQIHDYQLLGKTPAGQDRKQFTHDLSIALLARLRSLHGAALKPILKVLLDALQQKEIEVYFRDPRAESVVMQLGLAGQIQTGSDGFYVVDANDGGNKANTFVTERQTDVVSLYADGSAVHHLQIAVTYNKIGPVFEGATGFEDYSDIQRTYLPQNAEILAYAGFTPPVFYPVGCYEGGYTSPISDCDPNHTLVAPVTSSDVIDRAMVMGPVLVTCGGVTDFTTYDPSAELNACRTNPIPQTVNIYITWLTPHAVTVDAHGHGTYHELVEKQPGSVDTLVVYVQSPAVTGATPSPSVDQPLPSDGAQRVAAFAALLAESARVYSAPLLANTTITCRF
jgi:hypothetical protein